MDAQTRHCAFGAGGSAQSAAAACAVSHQPGSPYVRVGAFACPGTERRGGSRTFAARRFRKIPAALVPVPPAVPFPLCFGEMAPPPRPPPRRAVHAPAGRAGRANHARSWRVVPVRISALPATREHACRHRTQRGTCGTARRGRAEDMGAVIALDHATEARTDPIQSGAVLLARRSLSRAAGPAASLPASRPVLGDIFCALENC